MAEMKDDRPRPEPPAPDQPVAQFDRIGHLRRARRIMDVSQRELAALLGVAPSTVARAESSTGDVSLTLVTSVLEQAGLRLAVVDADGKPVAPMRADGARDHAGRRCPAHLDAVAMTRQLAERNQAEPRYRMPARASVTRRPLRDLRLVLDQQSRPADHVADALVESTWRDEDLEDMPYPWVRQEWRARHPRGAA